MHSLFFWSLVMLCLDTSANGHLQGLYSASSVNRPQLVDIRDHKPSILNRFAAELLHVPVLGIARR